MKHLTNLKRNGDTKGAAILRILWVLPVIFLFFAATGLKAERKKVTIYENPKPNCEEKVFVKLEKVAEIKDDIDSEDFLVMPWSLVVDAKGNIYVYDYMMGKIYKYDKDLNLVTTFGGKGRGPGEFGSMSGRGTGRVHLCFGPDGNIYAGDKGNRKIVCFDPNGQLVKEIRMDVKPFTEIIPAMDSKGRFYIYGKDDDDGIINVYSPKGERVNRLLDRNLLPFAMFKQFRRKLMQTFYYETSRTTISHAMVKGDRLIVYSKLSGSYFLLKENKVIKSKKLWPKKALQWYKDMFIETLQDHHPQYEGFHPYFTQLTIDQDDERFFYQYFGQPNNSKNSYMYKFDLNGNLDKVFYYEEPHEGYLTKVMAKRNGLFYAIGPNKEQNKTIMIFKEVVKK